MMFDPDPDDLDAIDAATEAACWRRLQAKKDFHRACIEAGVGDASEPDVEWEESDEER